MSENNQNCSVLYCVRYLYTVMYTHTCEQFLNLHADLGLDFLFMCLLGLLFCVSIDHFIPVLLAFIVLVLVSSVPS